MIFSDHDHCTCDRCQGVEWPPIPIENLQKFANELGPVLQKIGDYCQQTALAEYTRIYAEFDKKQADPQ